MDDERFRYALIREGLAKRTIETHIARYQYFKREIGDFTTSSIDAWICRELERGLKHNSINSYLKTIKKIGHVFGIDELTKVKLLPPNASPKPTMSEEEITDFLNLEPDYAGKMLCHTKRFQMFTLFFYLLAHTGARTHEIFDMRVDQIDLGSKVMMINATKTNDIRYIPVNDELVDKLSPYITGLNQTDKLFPITSSDQLRKQFKLRLTRLGINRPGLTPYCLRRSFITRLLDIDTNLFVVKNLVGHRKTSTTERYYNLTQKKQREAIKKDPLIRKRLSVVDKMRLLIDYLDSIGFLSDPDFKITMEEKRLLIEGV